MNESGAIDLGAAPAPVGLQIRLLICLDCNTIEELPDYEGPADRDHLLALAIEQRHTDNVSGTTHRGNLLKVPLRYWADASARAQIVKQIRDGTGGISELDPEFYDTKSNFQEDALACYMRHLRPAGACPDWKSDSKKLVPKTKDLRADVGLPDPKHADNLPYLCYFCPVAVFYAEKARSQNGLYS